MKFSLVYNSSAGVKLWYPDAAHNYTHKQVKDMIGMGGCGPGAIGDKFVPDSIYGLDVSPACYIHDLSWALAGGQEDKVTADNMFLCNMLRLNDASNSWGITKYIRLRGPFGIYNYYEAVAYIGNLG